MSLIKKEISIKGMTCVNCQRRIQKKLRDTAGIEKASVSYEKGCAELIFDTDLINLKSISHIIEKLGYEVVNEKKTGGRDLVDRICLIVIIIGLYMLLECMGILNLLAPGQLADSRMSYGMLFIIGLITSVHCIAMCGGINLSQCLPQTQNQEKDTGKFSAFRPAVLYNLGRVISYTAIGLILGFAGFLLGGAGKVGMSTFIQGILKIIAGIYMVIMGVNMLGLFPWFRRFTLRVPKGIAEKVRKEKTGSSRPFYVGLLNGLMPCGPLQSMWIVAFAAMNPLAGALSMLLFALGTVPLMLGLGSAVSALGKKFTDKVMTVGAVLVVVLGLAMLSQGVSLSGWNYLGKIVQSSLSSEAGEVQADEAEIVDDVQIINSTLEPGRFPNITVRRGIPVKWNIDAPDGSINGCNYKMLIPDYDIEYTFETGENVIEFTPVETGTVPYTCWMGMIHGNIFVVDETAGEGTTGDTGGDGNTGDNGTSGIQAGARITVPTSSGYAIPTRNLAIAAETEYQGQEAQELTVTLTDQGFEPAVMVVEADKYVIWNIENRMTGAESGTDLFVPEYSTKLTLSEGTNQLMVYPGTSFEIYAGDDPVFAYMKVVEDIASIDEEAIRQEAAEYDTLIYPEEIFQSAGSGGSCCQ